LNAQKISTISPGRASAHPNSMNQEIVGSLQTILRTIDFSKILRDKKTSITLAQMRVLSFFSENKVLHISEVSKALDMSIASVNNMVTRLEKAGYVERSQNKENKRFSDISLTPKGKRGIASFAGSHYDLFRPILQKLNKKEIEELKLLLFRVAQIIEKASI